MEFKITKDYLSTIRTFLTLEIAQQWAIDNMGENCIIEEYEDYAVQTIEDKLKMDIAFGQSLIETFLLDNRNIYPPISVADSLAIASKFANIEILSRLGNIKSVQVLLNNMATDEIFTQDRKTKYLEMINNYFTNA